MGIATCRQGRFAINCLSRPLQPASVAGASVPCMQPPSIKAIIARTIARMAVTFPSSANSEDYPKPDVCAPVGHVRPYAKVLGSPRYDSIRQYFVGI